MGGMGFRDIELFNLALLARQAWRIMQDPASLSARVLKAVYFPANDFLEADLGSSPSRVWRAVWDGREVLTQGLIRRICTGQMTQIWGMNWLPRDGLMRPVRNPVTHPLDLVIDLVDQANCTWDMEVLHMHFNRVDQEIIQNIPLSSAGGDDFWAWHYERTGIFSVCSA